MPDETTADAPRGKRPRRTAEQELAYLEQRIAKIKSQEQARSRKAETREKIVIGGAIVKAMRDNSEWRARVVTLLQTDVTRPVDREAIASWLSAT